MCLKRLSQWNKDNNCTKMFRVQDKGSRLVVESKERYKEKMLQYLEDISVFREDGENQIKAVTSCSTYKTDQQETDGQNSKI